MRRKNRHTDRDRQRQTDGQKIWLTLDENPSLNDTLETITIDM